MKNILYIVTVFFLFTVTVRAQIFKPVKWQTSVEKVSESEYDLVVTATIDEGWHLYSQSIPDDGPIPTTFSFKNVESKYQLIGKTIEGKGHEEFDKVFEMNIKYFEDEAIFKQRIYLLTKDKVVINESVEFMVCDDTSCLPPTEQELHFELQGSASEEKTKDTLNSKSSEDNPKNTTNRNK